MSDQKRCPRCDYPIDPLDLSELYRGKKRPCVKCGTRLQAGTNYVVSFAATLLIGVVMMSWLQSELFTNSAVGTLIFMMVMGIAAWLMPPGLIEGAPWVKIRAEWESNLKPRGQSED